MLRRTPKESPAPVIEKPGGKGRATPSRKEAETAARARARAGMDKKTAAKVLRERRAEDNKKVREGMRSGDPKYLMARDKGPVKAFVRDFIDSRLGFMEFLLPVLVLVLILQMTGVDALVRVSSGLWTASILLLLVDTVLLNLRLSREINRRFPDEETRGWRFYAFMRAIQIRPLRMPKARVKVRQKLPERY